MIWRRVGGTVAMAACSCEERARVRGLGFGSVEQVFRPIANIAARLVGDGGSALGESTNRDGRPHPRGTRSRSPRTDTRPAPEVMAHLMNTHPRKYGKGSRTW